MIWDVAKKSFDLSTLERLIIIIIILFWFYGPSRLFHCFWAKSIVRWGENEILEKTTYPPVRPQAEL